MTVHLSEAADTDLVAEMLRRLGDDPATRDEFPRFGMASPRTRD